MQQNLYRKKVGECTLNTNNTDSDVFDVNNDSAKLPKGLYEPAEATQKYAADRIVDKNWKDKKLN